MVKEKLKKTFINLEVAAKEMDLTINEHKTKYMETSRSFSNNNSLYINILFEP